MIEAKRAKFIKRRIVLDTVLLFGVFLFPMWLEFLIVFLLIFLFDNYYEAIILAIIADAIYSVPDKILPIPIVYTLSTAVVFTISVFVKRQLRLNL